jgi:hypothetical protein
MGLDLTVAPIRHTSSNWWLGHTRIDFDRNYDLFGQIADCGRGGGPPVIPPPMPIPPGVRFDWYSDEGIKTETCDPYGEPLTYVIAGWFSKVNAPEQTGKWNRAVLQMLQALPPETPVVLWWH